MPYKPSGYVPSFGSSKVTNSTYQRCSVVVNLTLIQSDFNPYSSIATHAECDDVQALYSSWTVISMFVSLYFLRSIAGRGSVCLVFNLAGFTWDAVFTCHKFKLLAPRGQVAVVPIVFVGALAAIQSSAREYYNDS
jgi:hypothetical protein